MVVVVRRNKSDKIGIRKSTLTLKEFGDEVVTEKRK